MSEENYLYEYAVVRYVPAVERSEFINVGLIMMCKKLRWLRLRIYISDAKVACFKSEVTPECLRSQLNSFKMIADGEKLSGPIASYPVEERFRWLTAVKSACIQTSRPHPGLTKDLETEFEKLFEEQVL